MGKQMDVEELVNRIGGLPMMPGVAQRAFSLILDPESSMKSLAEVVSLDPSLAGLVLRWANSAYYGLTYPATTVQQAVTRLGQDTVYRLVLTASMSTVLERPAPGYALEKGDLWRHSVGVAAGARLIAEKFGKEISENAYTAGLLCDIGKLGFEILLRKVNTDEPGWQGTSFNNLEEEHFGVDHAALGAVIVKRWNLPYPLVDAIAHHHQPSQATGGADLAAAVHIADAAMMMFGIGIGRDGLQYSLDPWALEKTGWNERDMEHLYTRVKPFIDQAEEYLHPKPKPSTG
jgi:putative nucleotidyltransferase with HDIG domain